MRVKNYYDYYFIYLTKNLINNKCYVGWHATNNLNDGYAGSGRLLKKSIEKYGKNNHITGIIEFGNKKNILEKEIYWIKKKNTTVPFGYNLSEGGDGGNTYVLLSEEEKKKFREKSSLNNKGKKISEETKEKIRKHHLGHSWNKGTIKSAETRKKMSEAWKHRDPVSEETKQKISKSQMGHKRHTNESKQKICEANSKRVWKEESKIKISLGNKGKIRSSELKQFFSNKNSGSGNGHSKKIIIENLLTKQKWYCHGTYKKFCIKFKCEKFCQESKKNNSIVNNWFVKEIKDINEIQLKNYIVFH